MKFKLFLASCLATSSYTALASTITPTINTKGNINAVTLYRGQAQIQRSLTIDTASGIQEIVVTNLPSNIIGSSLFAESSDAIEIRAVRYRARREAKATSNEVSKLNDQISSINELLTTNSRRLSLFKEQENYLKTLSKFVGTTAKVELSKGVLNAETLKQLTEFQFSQGNALLQTRRQLEQERSKLNTEHSQLVYKRNQLSRSGDNIRHEAIIFAEKLSDKSATIALNYIVRGTGWTPSYNLRGNSKKGESILEYNAVINQTSGEDWRNVKLTLSTATPSLSAAGPGLAPFPVSLNNLQRQKVEKERIVEQVQQRLNSNRYAYQLDNAISEKDNLSLGWKLNNNANEVQLLELNAEQETVQALIRQGSNNGPSLSYPLPKTVTLLDRKDQQMVRIFKAPLSTSIYHVATPILNNFVYREGEIKNSSGLDLLNGSVSVYLDHNFVGKTEIPNVAKGQQFLVGFGADPRLRTARQLITRNQSVTGGNQIITTAYRLSVENFTDESLAVRMLDRIPYSMEKNNIRVTLSKNTSALSKDELYLENDAKRGVLRWDITVAGRNTGKKATTLEYEYQMEFDKKLQIAKPVSKTLKKIESEFYMEQRSRKFR